MVLFIKKSSKFPQKTTIKLAEFESIALKSFQSYLSNGLNEIFSDQIHKSSSFSLTLYIPCFKFLQRVNIAFIKLLKDLNFSVENWKENLTEDYLSFSLSSLDALNLISSSISHLGVSRLSLIHGVSLIHNSPSLAMKHLKPMKLKKIEGGFCKNLAGRAFESDKERVVYEAMMKMKDIVVVILKVLVSGVSEVNNVDFGGLNCVEFEGLNLRHDEGLMVNEIVKVNEAVKSVGDCLLEGKKCCESEELKNMLGELESLLELVNKEVNCLFSDVLAKRSEFTDCLKV